ncbi:MAG: hypothetical protein AVDCRST_MAG90-1793 [uncultured Microvirga sp.]|uniref:Uncharacterized protein n=1 Tax=uncultured Microvirga sp. TaxID=412392 RepID=A0A6J4LMW1_9HYPH|nr:MAG: hypothetical protein AVDCRST_MAG90-1793 [uncultured Microvirga sp.]
MKAARSPTRFRAARRPSFGRHRSCLRLAGAIWLNDRALAWRRR